MISFKDYRPSPTTRGLFGSSVAIVGGSGVFQDISGDNPDGALFIDDAFIQSRFYLEQAPTIALCVLIIGRMFRSLKLDLFRPNGEKVKNHYLLDLFNKRPNEIQTPSEFKEQMASELVYLNECIIRIHYRAGKPFRMSIWSAEKTSVVPVNEGFEYQCDGNTVLVNPFDENTRPEIMHMRMNTDPYNPIKARSPFYGLADEVNANIYSSRFRKQVFRQGGNPRLALKSKTPSGDTPEGYKAITEQQMKEHAKSFSENVKTPRSYIKTPFLPQDADVEDLGPKGDLHMTPGSRYVDERLTAACGVPLIVINNLEKSTYSNSRQQRSILVQDAIHPRSKELEECIIRDMLLPAGGVMAKFEPRFDLEELVENEVMIFNKMILDRVKLKVISEAKAREEFGYDETAAPGAELDEVVDDVPVSESE